MTERQYIAIANELLLLAVRYIESDLYVGPIRQAWIKKVRELISETPSHKKDER